jgi:CheY-like chemotaxis protein
MDVQMPVLNGYDATRRIRRMPALANLPVVALTAGAFSDQQELASQAGMTGFLAKPFDVEGAIALIIKLTGHVTLETASARDDATDKVETNLAQPLPGIAYDKALAIWRDVIAYKKFLRLFARDYAEIAADLRQGRGPDVAALTHKFKGAAANMALPDVAARADELLGLLRNNRDTHNAIDRLQTAMDVVLETIGQFAPPEPSSGPAEIRPEDTGRVLQRLDDLLNAWSSSSTREIRTAMAGLDSLIPKDWLSPLFEALDSYDFHAGADVTLKLISHIKALKGDS